MSRRVSEQQHSLHRPETPHYEFTSYAPDASITSTPAPVPFTGLAEMSDGQDTTHHEQFLHPPDPAIGRSSSVSSTRLDSTSVALTKNGTLRKRTSTNKRGDLSRKSSRKSMPAPGGHAPEPKLDEQYNNVFRVPIPTSGNPTEVLANRFQAWRRLLKDLITYFREIQTSYEARSKALSRLYSSINNLGPAREFMSDGGLNDALGILRTFTQVSVVEANKARSIEEDVITQLNSLRNDLNQKIKEIKSLSGDFKNAVDKEKENTKRVVDQLRDALSLSETNPAAASGKNDPFIVRLAVERQVEKQIDEENYLHTAYLNLEGSGRELEATVVGEIQKAYNAYAGILKREGDNAHNAAEQLRSGPIAIPKDWEWDNFVQGNSNFINPGLPLRKIENITYPGRYNPGAAEIRAGSLERKSKYLKSYTPGWYVLSPTHIHEFKSADHIHTQSPVMSLFLLDQKLGSHSQSDGNSNKFSLKGRQSGMMHRGHSWVFRAESYDTMMAWYEDIQNLIEKTGEEKLAFVRRHARNTSGPSTLAPSALSSEPPAAQSEAEPIPVPAIQEDDEADTMPLAHDAPESGGPSGSALPAYAPRSATSSVYGGAYSFAPDTRSLQPPRSVDAFAHDQDQRSSGDFLLPANARQAVPSMPRNIVSGQYSPYSLDVMSTPPNSLPTMGRHDDSVDPLEQPGGFAMRQYLDNNSMRSTSRQSTQQPRPLTLPTGHGVPARPTSNLAYHQFPRSSAEYSPTSTTRDAQSVHARSSVPGSQRNASLSINVTAANNLHPPPNAGQTRDSAEYSPTSMPKMALNFAGGAPVVPQAFVQPPTPLTSSQDPFDRRYDDASAPRQSAPEFGHDRPQNSETRGVTATDISYGRPLAGPITSTNGPTNLYGNGRLGLPSMQQWRKSSSVYEGEGSLSSARPLSRLSNPTSTTLAELPTTPSIDGDATTTTTYDPDRDRDELTVTTTTEPRTSVDTTIQIGDAQESSNEKDDEMMNGDSEVGVLRTGKWDGTVPVLSEVYVPSNKFPLSKSLFSEHFDD